MLVKVCSNVLLSRMQNGDPLEWITRRWSLKDELLQQSLHYNIMLKLKVRKHKLKHLKADVIDSCGYWSYLTLLILNCHPQGIGLLVSLLRSLDHLLLPVSMPLRRHEWHLRFLRGVWNNVLEDISLQKMKPNCGHHCWADHGDM